MAAGIGALTSAIGHLRKKLPVKNRKISVVYKKGDGTIDWPTDDKINNSGVLVVPEPMTDIEWELFSGYEDAKEI